MRHADPMEDKRLANLTPQVRRIVLRARGELQEPAKQDPPPRVRKKDRPRCGARTRKGRPCRAPVVWNKEANAPRNGRCRIHGGLSTGPKTLQGIRAVMRNLEKANDALRQKRAAQEQIA